MFCRVIISTKFIDYAYNMNLNAERFFKWEHALKIVLINL